MKRLKKIIGSMLMVMMLCMMMTTVAYAADDISVLLRVADTSDGEGTNAVIITESTVTSGLLRLTYDSDDLTYQGLTVDEAYVAMYAVNADEEGVLLISWVAPEAYEVDGEPMALIQINFTGTAEVGSMELTGEIHDASGDKSEQDDTTEEIYVDIAPVVDAIATAETLNKDDYTENSYAAVAEALTEAQAVLEDPTAAQEELDAAAEALIDAIDALVDLTGLKAAIAAAEAMDLSNYTDGTAQAYREAIAGAKAVLNDPAATKDDVATALAKLDEEEKDLVDGESLRDALRVASYKEEYKYTKKSYKALKEAVDTANAVMKDPDATRTKVSNATTKLQRAINALQLLETYGGTTGTATGDNANIVRPAVLAVAAVAVISVAVVMKKRGLAK